MQVGKVLVVDDSKVVQFKLRRMLEARGLVVDTAASGRESLDYLKTKTPDVIFMDFMMADMDGYEVTAQIMANPATSAIPVIMCTGHDTPADRERAKESGACGFVTKPVDDASLDAVIAQLHERVVAPEPTPAVSVAAPTQVAPPPPNIRPAPIARPAPVDAPAPAATPAPAHAATSTGAQAPVDLPVAQPVAPPVAAPTPVAAPAPAQAPTPSVAPKPAGVPPPVAPSVPAHTAEVPAHASAAELTRVAERIAGEVAERLVREATATLSAASEQASRRVAQTVAASATQDALASWRKEVAKTNEHAELVAIAAAERVAREIAQQARDDAEDVRRSNETADAEKMQGALAAVQATAERVARQTLEPHKAAIDDQSRQFLVSARADLQESVRVAAESAAKPVAETAGRAAAEQLLRVSMSAAREDEAVLRTEIEQSAIAVAEQATREMFHQVNEQAEAARLSASTAADFKLQEMLATVPSTAERVALQTIDSAKAVIEDASREVLESARADLVENVRIAAESAAKPAAESTARTVAEQLMRISLAAAREDDAALRMDVEQAAIAAAEHATRGMLEQAGNDAEAARQLAESAADERLNGALATIQPIAESVALQTLQSARAVIEEASRQVLEAARVELNESVRIAAESAAKPAAETAARAAAEAVAVDLLTAAHEDEMASRSRVEERAIAVMDRVGRELVKLAFSAATAKPHAGADQIDYLGGGDAAQAYAQPADAERSADARAALAPPRAAVSAPAETPLRPPPPQAASAPPPPAWSVRAGLLAWLGALTLAVLYLLTKSFF